MKMRATKVSVAILAVVLLAIAGLFSGVASDLLSVKVTGLLPPRWIFLTAIIVMIALSIAAHFLLKRIEENKSPQPSKTTLGDSLTSDQRAWMKALADNIRMDIKSDEATMYAHLKGYLKSEFKPSQIDSRLCSSSTKITLFGLAVVDPLNPLLIHVDEVAHEISRILQKNPTQKIIAAKEIAENIGKPVGHVASTLSKMAGFQGAGYFHSMGSNYVGHDAIGWQDFSVNEPELARRYLSYPGIKLLTSKLLASTSFTWF
jgi:hypothetical protein